MSALPEHLATLPKRYVSGDLLIKLWERDSEGEPQCFLCRYSPEPCDFSHFTVAHLIPQTWLRAHYPRGAVWVPADQRFRPATRFDRPDLKLEQIRSDLRNLVAARWTHHTHFDSIADSRHFKVPRDRLPAGFETFVFEFRAETEAVRRFGGIQEVAA